MADAYYVLSDTNRRKEYDTLYASRTANERSTEPESSTDFFSTFANMFTGAGSGTSTGAGPPPGPQRPNAEGVFGDVFEEVSVFFFKVIADIIYLETLDVAP